jgi:hypothetical protein
LAPATLASPLGRERLRTLDAVRIFRRRPTEGLLEDDRSPMAEVIGTTFTEDVDRLAERLAALDQRIGEMEARVTDVREAANLLPDQGDLVDAQVRSAQVSADLHMVALELRSELQRLRSELPGVPSDDAARLAGRLVDLTRD